MKQLACSGIDDARDRILAWSNRLYGIPELGFRERETARFVASVLGSMDLPVEEGIAITGCRARMSGRGDGPRLALLAELDALSVDDHPDSKPFCGGTAVHACGHGFQLAGMLAAVLALSDRRILDSLHGNLDFIATPAEEYIDLAYRNTLKAEGKIKYLSGKQEMIRLGVFDDVDLAMMFHSMDLGDALAMTEVRSNGFIAKQVRFLGKPSHAGSSPEEGINALNAATLAIMNIHAQRETFRDDDHVRVHPMITKGGDVVNVVPSDVRMDAYVRAGSIEAMKDANMKVDRALVAGADAVGAKVEIRDAAGYLPIRCFGSFYSLFEENVSALYPEGSVLEGAHFAGSFDFGDLSCLMPSIHPMVGGVSGPLHDPSFSMTDFDRAVLLPAKAMAMTAIDLLCDDARKATELLKANPPALTKEAYLRYLDSFS
jgi:amidohydrolase